jgi:drug/metabolite transporter (DMT)-like permease
MIKVGLESAPPVTAAAYRFIIASIIIFAILIHRRIRLPRTPGFYWLSLFLGLFQMGIPYGLIYWAEQHITSGLASILYATMPITVAVLARVFLGDSLTLPKIIGILIGTLGTIVIFWGELSGGGSGTLWGVCAALAGAACSSVSSIVVKKHSRAYHPIASIFGPMLIGSVVLVIGARFFEAGQKVTWNAAAIGSILYLAVFGSVVGFGLYFWIIKHIDVTVLSYQSFIIPVLACFLGWIFLREKVTISVAIGGGLILVGIALATFRIPLHERSMRVGSENGH